MSEAHESRPGAEDGERFHRLVNALDHAIVWELDVTSCRYTFVSEHSSLVLGYRAEEWMVDPSFLERHVHPDDAAKFQDALATVRLGESPDVRLEHRCITAIGAVLWVHTGVQGEHSHGRTILRGVTIDIHSVKMGEERERRSRLQLEEAVRNYEEIIAIVAHDLRSPLNAIVMGGASLAYEAANPGKVGASIVRSANQMARLIDDLQDLSSIRLRRLTVALTETTTDVLVRDAVEAFAGIAKEKKIGLRVSPFVPTKVRCDPQRISQVLSNLLGNAVKFTKPEGDVEVTVGHDAFVTQFTVRDTGPGIPAESIERIFERDWQAPETASLGKGLGLFISRAIVEAHAGKIWAESTLGVGTRVHFTVPFI